MKAIAKITDFGLTKGTEYNVSITDLKCYVVTLEYGFKTVVSQGHFNKVVNS